MTVSKAKASLLAEEKRLEKHDTYSLAAMHEPRKRSHTDMRERNGWCRTCQKNHSEELCWVLHPELAPDWLKAKRTKVEEIGKKPETTEGAYFSMTGDPAVNADEDLSFSF